MTERDYRKYKAINYSSLSRFSKHPMNYKYYKEPKDDTSLRFGSALDCLLTGSKEEFRRDFYVSSTDWKPTGKLKVFCDYYIELSNTTKMSEEDKFKLAYSKAEYSTSVDTVAKKLKLVKVQDYINVSTKHRKKTILFKEEYERIKRCHELLTTSKQSKRFFEEEEGVDKLYQHVIIFEVLGNPCKAMLDLLIVNHNTKTIEPCDLKTTGTGSLYFESSIQKWNYFLQAAFYTEAVKQWQRTHPELKDYTIENFKFIVIESTPYNPPIVYKMSDKDLEAGKKGGTIRNRPVRGYIKLIRDLLWHEYKNLWKAPREFYENEFVVTTDIFD